MNENAHFAQAEKEARTEAREEADEMSDGERLASLEAVIKEQTKAFEGMSKKVEDLVMLRRDLDYHRRDIDQAHEHLRGHDARLVSLEGKELLNRYARFALFTATLALCKLAWDSSIIVNQERRIERHPSAQVMGK